MLSRSLNVKVCNVLCKKHQVHVIRSFSKCLHTLEEKVSNNNEKVSASSLAEGDKIKTTTRVQDILSSGQFSVIVPPVSISEEGNKIDFSKLEQLEETMENERMKRAVFHIPAEGEGLNKGTDQSNSISSEETEFIMESDVNREKEKSLLKDMLSKEDVDENVKSSIKAILDVENKLKKQSEQQKRLRGLREARLKGITDLKTAMESAKANDANVENISPITPSTGKGSFVSIDTNPTDGVKTIYDPGYNLEDKWRNIRSRYSEEEYKRSATWKEIFGYVIAASVASVVCLGLSMPGFKKYILRMEPKKRAVTE
ncbi:hypothetical protein ABK040_010323 [Willaertia magna]